VQCNIEIAQIPRLHGMYTHLHNSEYQATFREAGSGLGTRIHLCLTTANQNSQVTDRETHLHSFCFIVIKVANVKGISSIYFPTRWDQGRCQLKGGGREEGGGGEERKGKREGGGRRERIQLHATYQHFRVSFWCVQQFHVTYLFLQDFIPVCVLKECQLLQFLRTSNSKEHKLLCICVNTSPTPHSPLSPHPLTPLHIHAPHTYTPPHTHTHTHHTPHPLPLHPSLCPGSFCSSP